jgi:hypothetical protein
MKITTHTAQLAAQLAKMFNSIKKAATLDA